VALLLDTHAFVWFVNGDARLSPDAADRIAAPDTRVFVSVVSAWELVIKLRTGKLVLDRPIADWWSFNTAENGFEVLNITSGDVLAVDPLPLHHRDPFDRLLIAQAIQRDLNVVTADDAFAAYPVQRIW
jgi:PIN domain nuclease of toxin-antitoxin system